MRTAFMFMSLMSFTSISLTARLVVRPESGQKLWRLTPLSRTLTPLT